MRLRKHGAFVGLLALPTVLVVRIESALSASTRPISVGSDPPHSPREPIRPRGVADPAGEKSPQEYVI